MRVITLTPVGEHLAKSFGAEPTDAMRILWHIRRMGGTSSDTKIQEFVVSGSDYAVAMRKLRAANAITEG